MSFFSRMDQIWSDFWEEEKKSFLTDITFLQGKKKIKEQAEICGITPRYININGEFVSRDRFVFLKKNDEIKIIRESQIIKSSVDIDDLQFADFHENSFTNQKYRVD